MELSPGGVLNLELGLTRSRPRRCSRGHFGSRRRPRAGAQPGRLPVRRDGHRRRDLRRQAAPLRGAGPGRPQGGRDVRQVCLLPAAARGGLRRRRCPPRGPVGAGQGAAVQRARAPRRARRRQGRLRGRAGGAAGAHRGGARALGRRHQQPARGGQGRAGAVPAVQ